MKLSIERSELHKGLGRLQAIVEKRNSMPILANALLEASDGCLHLAATDLEVGVRGSHPAEVPKEGSLTVEVGTLAFSWRLPLSSLLPPKYCPVDGEKLNGAWRYCPWHGVDLQLDPPDARN